MIPDPWLLAFSITAMLLLLGITSVLVNSELWMSEPLVCAAAGLLLGPVVLGLFELTLETIPSPVRCSERRRG